MRDQARSNSAVRINKFKGKQIKVSSYRTKNSVCDGGAASIRLLEVKLKVTPVKLNNGSNIRTHNFEFGGNHGLSHGDSGGPLTYINNGQHILIGVATKLGR